MSTEFLAEEILRIVEILKRPDLSGNRMTTSQWEDLRTTFREYSEELAKRTLERLKR